MHAAVVGAGIVGLAVARELLLRRPGAAVTVFEKEADVGLHQTGHNSGVVHSGVYYTPGSLRAATCVEGARLLEEFCADHGVPYRRRGKLIVAVAAAEVPRLHDLLDRGAANGIGGLRLLDPGAMREVEPHVAGVAALHVPTTAVVDFGAVARALRDEVVRLGGAVRTGTAVRGIAPVADGALVGLDDAVVAATSVVICAGLQSDRVAAAAGVTAAVRIVPFRGDFRRLRPERAGMVRGLVYPVPDPALPFLGVHATRRVDDAVWLGPSAVPALDREGYARGAMRRADAAALARDPAVWRLFARHRRYGVAELARDRSDRLLLRALRRLLPGLEASDLLPGDCGIRAQAVDDHGRLLDDFVLRRRGPVLAVLNAPSPAATASLAIARRVVDALDA